MDKKLPEITVIVPVYNNEKYLKKCMDSIAAQTYDNYEVILINDGSTDGSGRLCDSFAEKDERISVIHQENRGLASSRKRGVDAAKGKYITFVDSDDYIAPHMLETLYNHISNFDMVTCGFTVVQKDGSQKTKRTFEEGYVDFCSSKEAIYSFFNRKYLYESAWGKLVRKGLYYRIDMCEGAVPGEEICTTLQLLQLSKRVRALSEPMYYYRQNEEGISRGGYTPRHRKGLVNYINLCDSLIERFPEIKIKIGAYFCEYEMAVMTAMCRNDVYDIETINMLRSHLKRQLPKLLKSSHTKIYYKVSALMIIVNYKCFAFIFKRIRKFAGR